MKGAFRKSFKYDGLEMIRGGKTYFFFVSQDEQSPEQGGAEGASFLGTSFLADSLYPLER